MAAEKALTSANNLFFDEHQATLRGLGEVIGLPNCFSESLASAIELTQPWVKGDHTRPNNELVLTTNQSAALQPIFEAMNLKREAALPEGNYDHLIVPGAVQLGNNNRIKFVKAAVEQGDIVTGDIVLLGGQRRVFGEVESHLLKEDLKTIHEQGTEDYWIKALENKTEQLQWETDFMRLAAIKHLGALPLRQLHLRYLTAESTAPHDAIRQYEFTWRNMPLKLLHTLATSRPNGETRHTTESCVKEWVTSSEPVKGAVVGFIPSNPHRDRMARSCQRALVSVGRSDLELVVAGPASASGVGDQIHLGEIARNLYEDSFTRE